MPAPFLMARSMDSLETLSFRAFSMAAKSRGLPSGSGPPSFAATAISFTSLLVAADFFLALTSRLARSHWRPISDENGRKELSEDQQLRQPPPRVQLLYQVGIIRSG